MAYSQFYGCGFFQLCAEVIHQLPLWLKQMQPLEFYCVDNIFYFCFTQACIFHQRTKTDIRFSSQIFNIIGIVVEEENEESAMKCRVLSSLFQVKTVVKRLLFFIGLSGYFRFVKAFLLENTRSRYQILKFISVVCYQTLKKESC